MSPCSPGIQFDVFLLDGTPAMPTIANGVQQGGVLSPMLFTLTVYSSIGRKLALVAMGVITMLELSGIHLSSPSAVF